MRCRFVFAALFLLLTCRPAPAQTVYPTGRALVHARISPVRVTSVNYHGWRGALKISNGIVDVVVVPQIGRIMAFQYSGQPQTNPLYENPDWRGKTIADTDPTNWANFGGDKAWPAPQADWPLHAPRAWPPEQVIDGAPQIVQFVPNGLSLVTASSPSFACRIRRTLTLRPGEARLYIAQTLEKDPDAAGPRAGFPIGLWSVTQTRTDGAVYLPIAPATPVRAGAFTLHTVNFADLAPLAVRQGGLLRLLRDPQNPHKYGAEPSAGWVALRFGPDLLFSLHFPHPVTGAPAATDAPVEVYTDPGPANYLEMEMLGPVQPLGKGESLSYNVWWELSRLPAASASPQGEAAQVQAAMTTITTTP